MNPIRNSIELPIGTSKDFCTYCSEYKFVRRSLKTQRLVCDDCLHRAKSLQIEKMKQHLKKEEVQTLEQTKKEEKEGAIKQYFRETFDFPPKKNTAEEKVYRVFLEQPDTYFTFGELKKRLGGNNLSRSLEKLMLKNLITRKGVVKSYRYTFNQTKTEVNKNIADKINRYLKKRKWTTIIELSSFLQMRTDLIKDFINTRPREWKMLRCKYKGTYMVFLNDPKIEQALKKEIECLPIRGEFEQDK